MSFVFYFEIDDPPSGVRILGTFFGGADHRRQIWDLFGADGVNFRSGIWAAIPLPASPAEDNQPSRWFEELERFQAD